MPLDDSWAVAIETRGAVAGAAIRWQRRGRLFVTVVAKVVASYSTEDHMQLANPTALGTGQSLGLSELAPSMPRCDVVMIGGAGRGEVRLAIEREGGSVFDKRAEMASFAPVRAAAEREQGTLELSADHDFETYQIAPPDQRIDYLHSDETLLLEGVHDEPARVETRLPRVRPQLRLVAGDEVVPMRCYLDSLAIDAADRQCVLLFRASTSVATKSFLSRARAEVVLDAQPLEAMTGTSDITGGATQTVVVKDVVTRAVTPFSNIAGDGPGTQTIGGDPAAPHQTLPFADAGSLAASAVLQRQVSRAEDAALAGATLSVSSKSSAVAATPFDPNVDQDHAQKERERIEDKRLQVRRAAEAAAKRRDEEERARLAELEAAEKRRQDEVARFEREQEDAAQRAREAAKAELKRKNERSKKLRSEFYDGFKR